MANFRNLVQKLPGNSSKLCLVNFDHVETIKEMGEGLAIFTFKSGVSACYAFSATDMENLLNEDAYKGSTDAV